MKKLLSKNTLAFFAIFGLTGFVSGQGTNQTNYGTAGVYNYTTVGNTTLSNIPAGATLTIECYGGGGGGGGVRGDGNKANCGGGGGGGGYSITSVTNGGTANIIVGSGGSQGSDSGGDGGNGGESSVTFSSVKVAWVAGGSGGTGSNDGGLKNGGTGGNNGSGTYRKGGNGGNGATGGSRDNGGGGGGAGGTNNSGTDGTTATGTGVGGAAGGAGGTTNPNNGGGGDGGSSTGNAIEGGSGKTYGGGGGGGATYNSGGAKGGAGAQGYVRITISVPACTTPTTYNVTGGGSYCSGGSGVAVGLASSQSGVSYQLYNGATPVGTAVSGTGSAISFGNQTTATTYTVKAVGTGSFCTTPVDMTGNAVVTVNSNPTITTQPATTSTCDGGTLTYTVATSAGSPSYQWQYTDGSNWYDTENEGITGTNPTLTINPAPAGYDGIPIRCVVTAGGCSTNSNQVAINVKTTSTAATSASVTANDNACAGTSKTIAISGGSLGTNASWKWYEGSCSGTLAGTGASISVDPATTTTYYVRAEGDCGNTACVTVTVNIPSTPTVSLTTPNATVCHGSTVTLGGSVSGVSGTWTINLSDGSSQTVSSNGAWSKAVVPTATTTYTISSITNGSCNGSNSGTTTITLPSKNNALSGNESATCYLSGTNPIYFYAPSGNYIGSINPQGRTGNVTMSAVVSAPSTQKPCDPAFANNPLYETAYMGRSVNIDASALGGSGSVDVILAYSDAELLALQGIAGNGSGGTTSGNINDDIISLSPATLGITKVSGASILPCGAGNTVDYLTAGSGVLTNPAIGGARYVSFGVSNFSHFYIHGINNNSPLPITLTSFAGNCNNGVQLYWTTATETNVNHFEVYRSRNGEQWDKVTEVTAVGNASTANHYQANDAQGIETMYYKLRSVDNDGTYEDFNPISVRCDVKGQAWSLHPVPATTQATITIETDRAISDNIVVMDMNGRVVQTQAINLEVGVNYILLDVQSFTKGTYMVKMNNETEYKPLKLMKID